MINCIKENKVRFDDDIPETKNYCEKINFEKEKAKEWTAGYKEFLGVNKKIPYAFPHPVFNYRDPNQKEIFFENAVKIYNESSNMDAIECDTFCQGRLKIALKNEERIPTIIGRTEIVIVEKDSLADICTFIKTTGQQFLYCQDLSIPAYIGLISGVISRVNNAISNAYRLT